LVLRKALRLSPKIRTNTQFDLTTNENPHCLLLLQKDPCVDGKNIVLEQWFSKWSISTPGVNWTIQGANKYSWGRKGVTEWPGGQ